MSTSLTWLLDGIAPIAANESCVDDITLDSREVRAGSLFLALPGRKVHGLKFAAEAVAHGACVVLWEPRPDVKVPQLPPDVLVAAIPDLTRLVGRIADRFFRWPSSQLRITGITGTNGKSTCAYLLAQCLERLGFPSAYIGTLGWGRIAALAASTLTTPDVVTLNRQLAQLRAAGVREIAVEVSSQALDQERVAGVRFHSAAFTNLSREHLDYHETMAAYGAAKARLFAAPGLQHIIVNIGDAFGREFAQRYTGRAPLTAIWIGAGASGWLAERTLHAHSVSLDLHGISMRLEGSFGKIDVNAKLLGRFNAENCLVVIACLLSLGVPLGEAAKALALCVPPPGRMEVVEAPAGKPMAVIDYAHTPDALAKALGALREHCQGALWCVFGCGGDRDPGKRAEMGAIAKRLADRVIVTSDNPRSEDPLTIARAVSGRFDLEIVLDRRAAIRRAIEQAQPGDVVVVAGKGHETNQIVKGKYNPFDDRDEVRTAFAKRAEAVRR